MPDLSPRVVSVVPLSGYRLDVRFADGKQRIVDLSQRLTGPVFEPLVDPEEFKRVTVDAELGTVCWPGGVDLDPDVLYHGLPEAAEAHFAGRPRSEPA